MNQYQTLLEESIPKLPDNWNFLIGGGDINGYKFVVDCRPPIIITMLNGTSRVFTSYEDYHQFISVLFNPQKHGKQNSLVS